MKAPKSTLSFFLLLVSTGAQAAPEPAETPRDPYTRDEDISASKLTVEVEQRADGLYEYVYAIDAPESNKGIISSLYIDLTCDKPFEAVELPVPVGREGYTGNYAVSGKVTPTAVLADYGSAAMYGIARDGFANFLMYQKPGQQRSGMRLISPAEPGLRSYVLTPVMDNGPEWDYPEEPIPEIPWVEDFTVAGRIAAPGCPGLVEPVED